MFIFTSYLKSIALFNLLKSLKINLYFYINYYSFNTITIKNYYFLILSLILRILNYLNYI